MEIYVRAWPDDGKEQRISFTGGRIPAWSSTPGELLYETPGNRIVSVRYAVKDGRFEVLSRQPWSGPTLARTGMLTNFDADPSRPGIVALIPANLPPGWRADHLTFMRDFSGAGTGRE
jgi:serine/threonine-protein kinase